MVKKKRKKTRNIQNFTRMRRGVSERELERADEATHEE